MSGISQVHNFSYQIHNEQKSVDQVIRVFYSNSEIKKTLHFGGLFPVKISVLEDSEKACFSCLGYLLLGQYHAYETASPENKV